MKKTIATLAFLLIAGAIFAQEGAKAGFRLTPLVSWATITNDSTKLKPTGLESKAAMGFSFDFAFHYGFSDNVGLQTGINISTRGFKTETSQDYSGIGGSASEVLSSKSKFTAVEIPVGLKFRSPEIGDGLYVIGNFGVTAELNVANKVISDTAGVDISNPSSPVFVLTRDVERRDVDGLNLITGSFSPGLGVDWEFDWGMIQLMATYHWGLLSITDAKSDEYRNQKTKVNYLGITAGYYF